MNESTIARPYLTLMRCPFCKSGVSFDGFALMVGDPEPPILTRDVLQAATWATHCALARSLRDYLNSDEGAHYKEFWTDEEVQAADLKTVTEQK
jgi:hypothetical protein